MEIKQKAYELQIKNLGDDGTFEGYGSIFGNIDAYGDVVVKGAFSNHLQNNPAKSVKMLWQHDASQPIGTYESIYEDDTGLAVSGKLLVNDVPQARAAYALLKAGAISGLSIGYTINPEGATFGQDGVRYLKDLKLWEISIVTFPANREANVESVKKINAEDVRDIRDFEKFLRESGFSKQQAVQIASHGFKPGRWDTDEAKSEDDQLSSEIRHILSTIRNGAKI